MTLIKILKITIKGKNNRECLQALEMINSMADVEVKDLTEQIDRFFEKAGMKPDKSKL